MAERCRCYEEADQGPFSVPTKAPGYYLGSVGKELEANRHKYDSYMSKESRSRPKERSEKQKPAFDLPSFTPNFNMPSFNLPTLKR